MLFFCKWSWCCRSDSDESAERIAQLEQQLRQVQEETDVQHMQQLQLLTQEFEAEKAHLLEQLQQERRLVETAFAEGEASLTGQLRDDFLRLVAEQRDAQLQLEMEEVREKNEQERDLLVEELTKRQEQLGQSWRHEKNSHFIIVECERCRIFF